MPASQTPGPDITFTFDGQPVTAPAGVSIAAALTAAGIRSFGANPAGDARGLFCGMGTCHECLVVVDGRAGERACLTAVRPDMVVSRQPARVDAARASPLAAPAVATVPEAVDVLVIGAGPAGLETARVAARAGARVVVVDEQPAPGGQFFKQPIRPDAPPGDRQARDGAALIAAARAAGAELRGATLVWGAERDEAGAIEVLCYGGEPGRERAGIIAPRIVVVASGAHEVPDPLPGWTLPGVMTTGAAQTLIRKHGILPGRRVIIAGRGPLDLQVASEIRARGGEVVAIVQAGASPLTRPRALLDLARSVPGLAWRGGRLLAGLAGVPLLWRHRLARIEQTASGLKAEVRSSRGDLSIFEADTVCLSGRFMPASELPRLLGCAHTAGPDVLSPLEVIRDDAGVTSQPDVLVVGEAGGFGGAHVALAQGRLAGLAIARRLGRECPDDGTDARRRLGRHRRFQAALAEIFPAQDPPEPADGDLVICRCEAITLDTLRRAIAEHDIRDAATLKRLTRAGMGRCQSRYCGALLRRLAGDDAAEGGHFAPQMPVRPVPVAALGIEKPEWGGHKRALLPRRATPAATPLERPEAATVVIGGGIAGVSTAYFLARAGHDVLVVDQGRFNASASGGNAGSLHAQLLSFDFGAKAEGGGGPALATLPLQRDSIRLWAELEHELGADFEMKITGGLMVAETEEERRFLDAKTALERQWGIDSSVIDGTELRRMEPAITRSAIAAAWCPQEGKINPLVATQQVLDAARRAGARLSDRTQVHAITRDGTGYLLRTSRGAIRAGRVVNAAGAFAGPVGAMLGLTVPVFGAPLQMIVTEPAAPLVSRLVAHASRHLTLKQTANGSVLIGGGWTATLDPVHQHPRPTRQSLEGNLWIAAHVIPDLAKLRVVRSWGAMNINIDGAPILGEDPRAPGFFNAVTSNGYTLGPIVGRSTAELILDGRTTADISAFSVARFDRA